MPAVALNNSPLRVACADVVVPAVNENETVAVVVSDNVVVSFPLQVMELPEAQLSQGMDVLFELGSHEPWVWGETAVEYEHR